MVSMPTLLPSTSLGNSRFDIQALRALTVLIVVAFHAGLPVPGGFLGVDMFFVISAFVITAMLQREWLGGFKALVDFALALPERFIVDEQGTSKVVLRAAMRGIVPDEVLASRDKIGFETPASSWIDTQRPLFAGYIDVAYWPCWASNRNRIDLATGQSLPMGQPRGHPL